MDKKIGYSDEIFNDTYLETFYKYVNIICHLFWLIFKCKNLLFFQYNFNESDLLTNLFSLSKYGTQYALGLLRKEQESIE